MDDAIRAAVAAWLADPAIAADDKREIRDLDAGGDAEELADRFYRRLAFGTGGMRGIVGAGLNRMNVYTLGAAAQGLATYIKQHGSAACTGGVVIAYDCRMMSDAFARRTASVMAGNGIKSYLFDALRPTPELSFAVRHLQATAGVVITASHNPPQYNGFKIYWSEGVQIVPPHDEHIVAAVDAVTHFGDIQSQDFDDARAAGDIHMIGEAVDEAFLDAVQASCLIPEVCAARGQELRIVFTGLHGTGSTLIPQALARRGFTRVHTVDAQAAPDGRFPTVDSPNPEEPAALAMAIDDARRVGGDVVIGTDPDADRVGIAVRDDSGDYVLLSGNRTAALLTHYICEQHQAAGRFPENAVLITTVVSGDMMKDIARSYGAKVIETLTGFKWIGQLVSQFAEEAAAGRQAPHFLFGAEESYGYMPATFTTDKDAVTRAAFIADAAVWARTRGQTLLTLLDSLFERFGYYEEQMRSVVLEGRAGEERIEATMRGLRSDPPAELGGMAVARIADLQSREVRDRGTGAVIERIDLPPANVVIMTLADGTKAIARPSGTEPKIKFYILTRESADGDLAGAGRRAAGRIAAVLHDVVGRVEEGHS